MRCWLLVLLTVAAHAATPVFDFETDAEVARFHDEGRPTLSAPKALGRSPRFAASGRSSLRFTTPAWRPAEHGGAQVWPNFEVTPPVADWSATDRLAFTLVNVTDAPQRLMLFVTDSQVKTRLGLFWRGQLPPGSAGQFVIDLKAGFAEHRVNPRDIATMHFFTEDPPADLEVYLDRVLLLAPGEAVPPLPPSFLADVAALHGPRFAAFQQQTTARLDPLGDLARPLRTRLDRLADRFARPDDTLLTLAADEVALTADVEALASRAALLANFAALRPRVAVAGSPANDAVVGFASSMEKVLPRATVPRLDLRDSASLSLARGETESLQVVVAPLAAALPRVKVQVGALRNADGQVLPAGSVQVPVVGYVQTKAVPPYGSSHVGWWPDPLLEFLDTTDVAAGDAQAFWLRVRCPRTQPPGRYRGTLEVLSDGRPLYRFDLTVRVYNFEVPAASPLPMAVTWWPMYYEPDGRGGWREGEYRDTGWRTRHKHEWADFLADYYLSYDSLYTFASWSPDFEELARLKQQGRLGWFNLGYWGTCGASEAEIAKYKADMEARLAPRYERAKALGLLDRAYLYGCDENPKELFPAVERAAALLKARFPGVLLSTTTYDHSFGLDSPIHSVDAFCPLTPKFDPALVAKARAGGKQVWWYICCGPHHPHLNTFIEYPAIEARLLMGALTAKYRPDGFLYYQTSIWNSGPITTGPFTTWDPRSWTTYNGDGSWTCLGPDGTPLPTIRLENVRDGLEDYAYVKALEAAMARATDAAWLERAKAALAVPAEVATSLTAYTHDPAALYAWRERLAELLEQAGKP